MDEAWSVTPAERLRGFLSIRYKPVKDGFKRKTNKHWGLGGNEQSENQKSYQSTETLWVLSYRANK